MIIIRFFSHLNQQKKQKIILSHKRQTPLPNVETYNVLNVKEQVKNYNTHGRNEFLVETYKSTTEEVYFVLGIVILEDVEVLKIHTRVADKYDGIEFVAYQCLDYLSKTKLFKFYFTQNILKPSFSILSLAMLI